MYQRSYQLLCPENSLLVVVDIQERLLPVIENRDAVTFNASRLLRGAAALDVPMIVTEQYPKGLGPTVPELKKVLPPTVPVYEKKTFSICAAPAIYEAVAKSSASKIVLCGMETHICVLQSALDLLAMGREVVLVTDAVGSRFENDRRTALRSVDSVGVTLATTESVLFQWCHTAEHPAFKTISALARERVEDFIEQ